MSHLFSKFQGLIKVILFSFTALIVFSLPILVIAEIVARKFVPPIEEVKQFHNQFSFDIRSGVCLPPSNTFIEYGKEFKINSLGFRGPEIPEAKQGIRIAFMGDSYTQGTGVSLEDGFVELTMKQLRKKSPLEMDYINSGIGGSSPLAQYYIYNEKVKPLKPDLVVYTLHNNDLSDDFFFFHSSYRAHITTYNLIPKWMRSSRVVQCLYQFISEQKRRYNEKKHAKLSKYYTAEMMWSEWTKPSLEKIKKQVEEDGAAFILAFVPHILDFDSEFSEDRKGDGRYELAVWAEQWAKSNKVPFMDPYFEIEKANTKKPFEFFLPGERGLHLSEAGNELFATLLTDRVETSFSPLKEGVDKRGND